MEKESEIRFSFSHSDWSHCKLSDLVRRVVRKNTSMESDRVLTISAQYGLIDQADFFNKRIASTKIENYYLVKQGEFAYNKSYSAEYPVGAVKPLIKYNMGVLSTLYIVFDIFNNNVDSKWLANYFESNYWHHEILKRASEGARNHGLLNISADDFFDIPITLPSSKLEQLAIGKFFDNLDKYISSQALELQKLKNIKKACLEKMFPKKGELVPEIRFGSFEGNWERKQLKEYLETKVEKNENDKYNKFDIFSVSGDYGVVNQIKFQGKSFAGASLKGYKVTHPGQVIYTKSPLKAQPYGIIKTNNATDGIVSTLYAVYEPKGDINTTFVQYYFELDGRLNDYLRPLVNKGAKNTLLISDDDALNGYVVFPKDISEQQEVTKYFLRLDNFISNSARKLEKLKQIRKGLLGKMFVSND